MAALPTRSGSSYRALRRCRRRRRTDPLIPVRPRSVACSSSRKSAAASQRERTPSLPKTEERWLLMVLSERNSRLAIWALVRPPATSASTWRSRWERAGRSRLPRTFRGTTDWPLATARTVAARVSSSLDSNTKASAPASRARRTPVPVAGGEITTIGGCRHSRRRRRSVAISRGASTLQTRTMIADASTSPSAIDSAPLRVTARLEALGREGLLHPLVHGPVAGGHHQTGDPVLCDDPRPRMSQHFHTQATEEVPRSLRCDPGKNSAASVRSPCDGAK